MEFKFKKNRNGTELSAPVSERLTATTQFSKYHNPKTGHGFAAEDANARARWLHGNSIIRSGWNNAKDGADYYSNGVPYQVKYYETAQKTVESAFANGKFRYPGQKLEVPKDQFPESIEIFKQKIAAGQVRDAQGNLITDPNQAEEIVAQGQVTYKQARNIAKAGTVESLTFDAINGAVCCAQSVGISFAIDFACGIWSGNKPKEAAQDALNNAILSGATSGLASIVAAQTARTPLGRLTTIAMRGGVKAAYSTSAGKFIINNIASASLGKSVYGAAAIGHVSKIMSSTVVTTTATTVITTLPDLYRATFSKNISWTQFSKNFATNTASAVGGVGGWFGGAAAGAAIGSVIPGIGNAVGGIVGGIVGAICGGSAAGKAAKSIADKFAPDDAELMGELMQEAMMDLAYDYLLTQDEADKLASFVESYLKEKGPSLFLDMYGSSSTDEGRKLWFERTVLEGYCEELVSQRPKIYLNRSFTRMLYLASKNILHGAWLKLQNLKAS